MNNDLNYYSFAYIDLKKLKHNINVIKSLIKKGTKILIPVKCNAYGCGLAPVSQFLEKEKIDYLGVAFPFEGLFLRQKKIKMPVLIFNEVLYKDDFYNIIKNNLTPTVYTASSLKVFNQLGGKYKKKVNIHVKIDTGMGRIGVPASASFDFLKFASSLKNIKIEGAYTHLSSADESDKKFTFAQIKKFEEIRSFTKQQKIQIPVFHALNSAGVINYPEYCYNMVRSGIMFYGYFPDNKIKKNIPLKPCMDLRSKVLYNKKNRKGTPISYGHTYFTGKDEIIASVAGGYGDGINRLLSNNGKVLFHDKTCHIRGRICMDQFMINISPNLQGGNNNLVTIFGRDIRKEIKLEHLAKKLKTIPYEILCLIGERIKRIYLK